MILANRLVKNKLIALKADNVFLQKYEIFSSNVSSDKNNEIMFISVTSTQKLLDTAYNYGIKIQLLGKQKNNSVAEDDILSIQKLLCDKYVTNLGVISDFSYGYVGLNNDDCPIYEITFNLLANDEEEVI